MKKERRIIILLIIIICTPCLIFFLDDFFRHEYEDPFIVSKKFSYSYMTKNTKNMKSWAYKEVYEKIDNLQYSTPVDDRFSNYSDFELVCFQRLGNTIVSTYGQNIILPVELPLFYSVVLELVGSDSLWERVTEFIYFEVPLGRNICSFPRSKDRWLVVDFFTNDDYGQYTIDLMEKYDNEWFPSIPSTTEISKIQNYEELWSNAEKIRQNREMEELYMDYIGLKDEIQEVNQAVEYEQNNQ